MQKLVSAATLVCLISLISQSAQSAVPNVVLVQIDQLSWSDLEATAAVPNLIRLSREGLQFRQFYVAPSATATRVGLQTGLWPIRLGIHNEPRSTNETARFEESLTLAKMMELQGFDNRAMFGIWGAGGGIPENRPEGSGYNHFYGALFCDINVETHRRPPNPFRRTLNLYGRLDWYRDSELCQDSGNANTLAVNEAVQFIRRVASDKTPYFASISLTSETGNKLGEGQSSGKLDRVQSVSRIDSLIGDVLDAIEETGERNDTIVWLMAIQPSAQKLNRIDQSGDISGGSRLSDRSLVVPSFLRYPNHIDGNRTAKLPTGYVDLLPTIGQLVGCRTAEDVSDGVSLLFCRDLEGGWAFNQSLAEARTFFHSIRMVPATANRSVPHGDNSNWCAMGQTCSFPINTVCLKSMRSTFLRDPSERRDISARSLACFDRMLKICSEFRGLEGVREIDSARFTIGSASKL